MAVFFLFGQFFERVERFFFGRADEAAGVNNQHFGFAGAFDGFVAVVDEKLGHRVGIDGVFGAAKRDEMKGFAGHTSKYPFYGSGVLVTGGVRVGEGVGDWGGVTVGVGLGVGVGVSMPLRV